MTDARCYQNQKTCITDEADFDYFSLSDLTPGAVMESIVTVEGC
jgi:hypothetical protein